MKIKEYESKGKSGKEIDLRTLDDNEVLEIIISKNSSPFMISGKYSKVNFPIYKWKVLYQGEEVFLNLTSSLYQLLSGIAFSPNSVLLMKKIPGHTIQNRNGKEYKTHLFEVSQGGRIWRNYKKKDESLPFNLSVKEVQKPTTYEQSIMRDFKTQAKAHNVENITRDLFVSKLVNEANIKKDRAEMLFDYWY